jgi:putative heme iron utilization protein
MTKPKRGDMLQTFDDDSLTWLTRLVRDQRSASLATVGPEGGPAVSLVAFAESRDFSSFWLHLSELAGHKRQLRDDPRCGLMIAEPDDGRTEPLQKHRLMLDCRAEIVDRAHPDYAAAKARYLAKLPRHEMMFSLGDFDLVRLSPSGGLLNAGFGKAYRVTPEILARAAQIE